MKVSNTIIASSTSPTSRTRGVLDANNSGSGSDSVPSFLGDETGEEGVLTLFCFTLKKPNSPKVGTKQAREIFTYSKDGFGGFRVAANAGKDRFAFVV